VFEDALRSVSAGWTAVEPMADDHWSLSAATRILSEGATVVLVRGLQDIEAAKIIVPLPELVGSALPSDPPLGDLKLAPEPKPPETATRIVDGRYVNDWMGVSTEMLKGWARQDNAPVPLLLRDTLSHSVATLSFAPQAPDEAFRSAFFQTAIKSFGSSAGEIADLHEVSSGDVDLGWGRAWSRVWRSDSHKMTVRALVLPACNGKAAYALMQVWSAPEAEEALEHWARSFDVSRAASSPSCEQSHTSL
jgi:hypothetical protein